MARRVVRTDRAPAAIGPYSQGVAANGFLFTAGQIPLDPATGEMVPGGIEEQARQALKNVLGVLAGAGVAVEDVVKVTVFLADINDYPTVNQIYAEFFGSSPPARSVIQAGALPRGARIEVEAIAALPGPAGGDPGGM